MKMKLDGWRDKPLHGQDPSWTDEKGVSCWRWLQTGYLKKEAERLLKAAQYQALATKAYKVTILKQQRSKKCKMCNERDGTVMHILSECLKLAHTEYKKSHAEVAIMGHWELCSKYGFKSAKHWYEHRAEGVIENQDVKILSDFNIRTDGVTEARRPDIVFIGKKNQETFILNMTIPEDFRVRNKEKYLECGIKN